MTKLKAGDFFHVKNATAKHRKTKYGVVVDPIRRIFFFINTRKEKGEYKSYPHYDEVWDCFNILKKKYQFLRYPIHCIACKNPQVYYSHDPITGELQNIITEKFQDSLDLPDLVSLTKRIRKITYRNKRVKKLILASIERGIWQALTEIPLTALRRFPARDRHATYYDAHADFLLRHILYNDLPAGKYQEARIVVADNHGF